MTASGDSAIDDDPVDGLNIVVCIKQVPDSAQIRVHPVTNTIMRQGVPTIINPYDLFALEEALRMRDQYGGRVTVLTMGPPMAEESLRRALGIGADRAVLLDERRGHAEHFGLRPIGIDHEAAVDNTGGAGQIGHCPRNQSPRVRFGQHQAQFLGKATLG